MLLPVLLTAAFLSALVLTMTLAHALEMPGKMRLDREQYYAVQTIYYPGFTIGGAAEPLAILATGAALLIGPGSEARVWLIAAALVALVVTHLLFWIVVQPVNRQWLQSTELSGAADRFFRTGQMTDGASDWTALRSRWEKGHLARTATAVAAFILLLIAIAAPQF